MTSKRLYVLVYTLRATMICVFFVALLERSSVSLEEINLISYMFSVKQSFKNESRALE